MTSGGTSTEYGHHLNGFDSLSELPGNIDSGEGIVSPSKKLWGFGVRVPDDCDGERDRSCGNSLVSFESAGGVMWSFGLI